MKKTLIYSLGRRGFFSEITNLALAQVYANKNGYSLKVNSRYWNCRFSSGMEDYFNNSMIETNNLLSAQITRLGTRHSFHLMDLHSWFYLGCDILNKLYKVTHKGIVFGADIYDTIRQNEFRGTIPNKEFLSTLRHILKLNSSMRRKIERFKDVLGIGNHYVGVHIRRGDKITTGEMNLIPLERYTESIKRTGIKNVYIATDDIDVIDFLKKDLGREFKIFHNPALKGNGFKEGNFNRSSKEKRRIETEILLMDIFVLFDAAKFIGTFSSNLSRVVPAYVDFKDCYSLDEEWSIC